MLKENNNKHLFGMIFLPLSMVYLFFLFFVIAPIIIIFNIKWRLNVCPGKKT